MMSTWAGRLPTFGLELVYWPSVAVFYPRLEHDYVKNERQSHIGRQLAESARPYPDKRGPDPTEREKKTDFSNYKQESGPESWVMRARFLGTFLWPEGSLQVDDSLFEMVCDFNCKVQFCDCTHLTQGFNTSTSSPTFASLFSASVRLNLCQ